VHAQDHLPHVLHGLQHLGKRPQDLGRPTSPLNYSAVRGPVRKPTVCAARSSSAS
jgi:hypothetical protein